MNSTDISKAQVNDIVRISRIGPFTSGEFRTYKVVEREENAIWAREKRFNERTGGYFWGHVVLIYSR